METYSLSKYSSESQEVVSYSPTSIVVDAQGDDDGPFFDIDFTMPLFCDGPLKDNKSPDKDGEEDEFEFNFSISSSNQPNPNQFISPADNLFYKGQLLPLQVLPNADMVRRLEVDDGKGSLQCGNVNGVKTQFPTLLKTATKLKISLFGLKKSAKVGMDLQASCAEYGSGIDCPVQKQNKFFTVKFKVVDVPLVSFFTRENSRTKRDEANNVFQKKTDDSDGDIGQIQDNVRDKKRAKQIVQNYVKKIKPLYVKISQRSNERTKCPDLEKHGVGNSGVSGSERGPSQFSFSGNLKMVYKNFGKGKNSSPNMNRPLPNYNSESTMLELQSAIQGAIAHCKKSNYATDAPNSSDSECSP
ncbi:hypothetical protein SUGI_0776790 [Cryptomeria japonica]|uniref:probable membrane-associated kinase regulator 2 n=1 Tax=Cryptomeria japonica TaxID=3369 RepID=UPI002414AC99|nr:probable membrane-associated kinase regulator 2 [Cryptomeria japonica]GLJ38154.1 hypothetical protein SUGI_0776790 [Cryptomeria japonica]